MKQPRTKTNKRLRVIIELVLEIDSDEFAQVEEALEAGRGVGSADVVDITVIEPERKKR